MTTATPEAARPATNLRISAFAPTSTPLVGSSSMSTRAARPTSHRDNNAFCWLPPESVAIRCSGPVVTMRRRSISSTVRLTSAVRLGEGIRFQRRKSRRCASTTFSRTPRPASSPWSRRSSGRRARPWRMASAGDLSSTVRPPMAMVPETGRWCPNKVSGATCALSPRGRRSRAPHRHGPGTSTSRSGPPVSARASSATSS